MLLSRHLNTNCLPEFGSANILTWFCFWWRRIVCWGRWVKCSFPCPFRKLSFFSPSLRKYRVCIPLNSAWGWVLLVLSCTFLIWWNWSIVHQPNHQGLPLSVCRSRSSHPRRDLNKSGSTGQKGTQKVGRKGGLAGINPAKRKINSDWSVFRNKLPWDTGDLFFWCYCLY